MVQQKSFGMDTATPIFTMPCKFTDILLELASSPITNNLFTTTNQEHSHPPWTVQRYLTYAQNLKIFIVVFD